MEMLEARWAADHRAHERESPVVGPLERVSVSPSMAVFPRGGQPLEQLLEAIRGDAGAAGIWSAVKSISVEDRSVVVHFGPGQEPTLQDVDGRVVACHLHGVNEAHANG